MLPKVSDISPNMGCDPEFFFKLNGQVIGAEKFIPKTGIVVNHSAFDTSSSNQSKFIIDGVQAELNPRPDACRANLGNSIKACFKQLKEELNARGEGITADFSRAVEISKDKLLELDESSRKFGCAPSKSIYRIPARLKLDKVDPTEYRIRAAGGHIHIGKSDLYKDLTRALTIDHEKTVKMLDIILGNTCVLVDRDITNIERRKLYGRAGEYRLPEHGLEYRTLSNFWLTSYPLMSFAFGLARLAVQLIASTDHELYYNEFTSKVKKTKVHKAINNNDFDLAMENFQAIEKLITEVSNDNSRYSIGTSSITNFYHFVKKVNSDGLEYWFKDDPLNHWINIPECHDGGFFDFLKDTVCTDRLKAA